MASARRYHGVRGGRGAKLPVASVTCVRPRPVAFDLVPRGGIRHLAGAADAGELGGAEAVTHAVAADDLCERADRAAGGLVERAELGGRATDGVTEPGALGRRIGGKAFGPDEFEEGPIARLREGARARADIGDRFRPVALGVGADKAAPVPEVNVQALVGEAVAFVVTPARRRRGGLVFEKGEHLGAQFIQIAVRDSI